MIQLLSIVGFLMAPSAFALTGDVNRDGYNDTIYIEGDYVKVKDGRYPANISSTYVGRYTMTVHSIQQLDSDTDYEIIVTAAGAREVIVVDFGATSATKYPIYRNGATGSADYQVKSVVPFNNNSVNQIVVMFPGDNYIWVLDHVSRSSRNFLVAANPTVFDFVEVDGKPGIDIVLFYAADGYVSVVSGNQERTPFRRDYHKNVGTNDNRAKLYGYANTDAGEPKEIVLYYTGSDRLVVIRDSAGIWGYGEERAFNLYGLYTIQNVNRNRDGQPGNEICYRSNQTGEYYYLNPHTYYNNITRTTNCN